MFGKKKPEVLVVGAGPVGLMAGLLLAKHGIQVQIVDKQWRTGAHSYALALHAESLRLFEEIGLLDRMLQLGYPVHRVGLYDGLQRRAEVRAFEAEFHSGIDRADPPAILILLRVP